RPPDQPRRYPATKQMRINEGTLGDWVAQYRKKHPVDEEPRTASERARLRELERENRELRIRNEFLGKASDRFAFIDPEKDNYPIMLMCESLKVSRAGFYEWCGATGIGDGAAA